MGQRIMFNEKEYQKNYRKIHHKDAIDYKKEWNKLNKDKIKKHNREYRELHRTELHERDKEYRKTHKEQANVYAKEYAKIKRSTNINFKLRHNLRKRIWAVLKGIYKSDKTMVLVGCNASELKKYLESKFTEGMTWSNYGNGWNGKGMKEWHIDHIKPCSSFDLSNPYEQLKCFNYTNLQPLWAIDNLIKGDHK